MSVRKHVEVHRSSGVDVDDHLRHGADRGTVARDDMPRSEIDRCRIIGAFDAAQSLE
jgi:hypothetical protein